MSWLNDWWCSLFGPKQEKVAALPEPKVKQVNVGQVTMLITYRDVNDNVAKSLHSIKGRTSFYPDVDCDDNGFPVHVSRLKVTTAEDCFNQWLKEAQIYGVYDTPQRLIPQGRVLEIFPTFEDVWVEVVLE